MANMTGVGQFAEQFYAVGVGQVDIAEQQVERFIASCTLFARFIGIKSGRQSKEAQSVQLHLRSDQLEGMVFDDQDAEFSVLHVRDSWLFWSAVDSRSSEKLIQSPLSVVGRSVDVKFDFRCIDRSMYLSGYRLSVWICFSFPVGFFVVESYWWLFFAFLFLGCFNFFLDKRSTWKRICMSLLVFDN